MYSFERIDRSSLKEWAKNLLSTANRSIWGAGIIIALVDLLTNITKSEVVYNEALGEYLTLRTTTTFSTVVEIFVLSVLMVGVARLFLSFARGNEIDLNELAFGFRYYFKVFLTYLWQSIVITLWLLLFIIPGIIKAISYSFVPFILAENPNIKPNEVLKISAVLTDGRKGELFVFSLSFIGWNLLSAITLGLASVYVTPYYQTCLSAIYDTFKADAIRQGRIPEDVFVPQEGI
ncbi:MAG: DUF975 family protein [Eubacteriaceae bacterium]|jgi:uncharacterized membrane protein|nr:DUF975 family protein [Eubacteriaceae bacterium]